MLKIEIYGLLVTMVSLELEPLCVGADQCNVDEVLRAKGILSAKTKDIIWDTAWMKKGLMQSTSVT